MAEVEVKFEREEREGIVAVGTYVFDAAGRLGVAIDGECGRLGACDSCAVTFKKGGELLSAPTKAEIEHLTAGRRKKGERLACQAKLEKAGEVIIMTTEKKSAEDMPEEEKKVEDFREEFEKMPLEKKMASLLELEAIALGETFSFILNSPYAVAGKVMDVMSKFGRKMEDESKDATRPDEHAPPKESKKEKNEEPAKKAAPKKAAPKPKAKKKAAKKTTSKTKE